MSSLFIMKCLCLKQSSINIRCIGKPPIQPGRLKPPTMGSQQSINKFWTFQGTSDLFYFMSVISTKGNQWNKWFEKVFVLSSLFLFVLFFYFPLFLSSSVWSFLFLSFILFFFLSFFPLTHTHTLSLSLSLSLSLYFTHSFSLFFVFFSYSYSLCFSLCLFPLLSFPIFVFVFFYLRLFLLLLSLSFSRFSFCPFSPFHSPSLSLFLSLPFSPSHTLSLPPSLTLTLSLPLIFFLKKWKKGFLSWMKETRWLPTFTSSMTSISEIS